MTEVYIPSRLNNRKRRQVMGKGKENIYRNYELQNTVCREDSQVIKVVSRDSSLPDKEISLQMENFFTKGKCILCF